VRGRVFAPSFPEPATIGAVCWIGCAGVDWELVGGVLVGTQDLARGIVELRCRRAAQSPALWPGSSNPTPLVYISQLSCPDCLIPLLHPFSATEASCLPSGLKHRHRTFVLYASQTIMRTSHVYVPDNHLAVLAARGARQPIRGERD